MPAKGKEPKLTAELTQLFGDLDKSKLRVSRPRKFIFLCGGAIPDSARARPQNLRDYLCRIRPLDRFFNIVLAEQAIDMYLQSNYRDLIAFEEDLARISSLVIVITESAGSLAELGSFSSLGSISPSLKLIVSEEHSRARSFVRYGPIQRIKAKRSNVGVYDWKSHKKTGQLNVASAEKHYGSIKSFIGRAYKDIPASIIYEELHEKTRPIYVIYWIVYLFVAVSPSILYDAVRGVGFVLSDEEIRNLIYCMELAKWIAVIPYGGVDYFYVLHNDDIFDYSFVGLASEKNSIRRKQAVTASLRKIEPLERVVQERALNARRGTV